MPNSDWPKVKEVFCQVLELPEAERETVLAVLDEAVRAEIIELLKAIERAEEFIAEPAAVELGFNTDALIGQKIGGYKLLELIGKGGMGTVFLAEKEGLEKKFAVKLIKRGMDTDEVLRRFQLEKKILARLQHPNIAPLIDGGMTEDGLPFLVMEYVDGVSINKYCAKHKLDTKERLGLFREICSAVSFAHQNLVIHRDLKPSNILVTEDGTPKLLDFGIAKLLDSEAFDDTVTTLPARRFTPEYASPEEFNGLPVTTASDVYSLGVVLYELLAGQRPFQSPSRNYQEIVKLILTGEPVRPSAVLISRSDDQTRRSADNYNTSPEQTASPKALKGDLDNIILKALRKDAERRYSSVQEFSEDIRRHLSGLPVTATADTSLYRISKFVGRHKTAVLGGTMVSVLVLTLSAFAVWQGISARRAENKSQERLKDIRDVARSLMTETSDSLQKIPGNIVVRKGLTEKSVALLDKLASDEENDTALLVELADAYTKLAEIQNLSFREFDRAYENLSKAGGILQRAIGIDPLNIAIRKKLHGQKMRLVEVFNGRNERGKSVQTALEAVENLNEIVRLDPESTGTIADLASVLGMLGTEGFAPSAEVDGLATNRKAMEAIEKAIELQKSKEGSPATKAEIARFYLIKGWLSKSAGENVEAIRFYQMAAAVAQEVYSEEPRFADNFLRLIGSHRQIAEVHKSAGNFQAAAESYLRGKEQAQIGLRNKNLPRPAEIRVYDCHLTVEAASVFSKLARKNEARRYFNEGETLCLDAVNQDPDRVETIHEELEPFYAIAEFHVANGDSVRAISLLGEIVRKFEPIAEKNEWDLVTAFALADNFEKIGDLQTGKTAREYYEKSNAIWSKYQQNYTLLPSEIEKMRLIAAKLKTN